MTAATPSTVVLRSNSSWGRASVTIEASARASPAAMASRTWRGRTAQRLTGWPGRAVRPPDQDVPSGPVATPAFHRLDVDERRRQLLELGARLFTSHTYTELSMARIAREAGISKALLYHYFPSKQEFFRATLTQAADELQARIDPPPGLS